MTKDKTTAPVETPDEPTTDKTPAAPEVTEPPLPTADPASAQIDPPPAPEPKGDETPESTSAVDAAAEALRATPRTPYLRDARGNKLDANRVFTAPDATGHRRANVRIIKHEGGPLGRPVATRLLAPGQLIGPAAAEAVLSNIRAERA